MSQQALPVAIDPDRAVRPLEPVDALGTILPIDPAKHHLDLPIIHLSGGGGGVALTAAERRLVAGEISRLAQWDPEFVAGLSEVTLDPRGDLRAEVWRRDDQGEIWDLPVTLRFHPNLPNRRVQEGLRVLGDAMIRFEGAVVADLDLRYEDQVVVRLHRTRGS